MANLAEIRKTFLATAFILALLLLAETGAQFVNLGVADPFIEERFTTPPAILLYSPLNTTYNGPILLNFTVTESEFWFRSLQEFNSASYYVDGVLFATVNVNSNLSSPFNYAVFLKNLSDGSHVLLINVSYTGWIRNDISGEILKPVNSSSIAVHFTLDTTPPTVSVLSLENKTHASPNVPLNFTVNESVSQITYSLDGQENVTVAGNTTLTGLSYGEHNVTVYATDTAGHTGVSETIYFSISAPEPFPTALIVASVVLVAVIGIGLLVYFRKRKNPKVNAED